MATGNAVSRLAAQNALLVAIWEALPEDGSTLSFNDLNHALAEKGLLPHTRTLRNALIYLESAGVLRCEIGDRWRRRETKK
jgi:hypothetical protein